MIKFLLGPEPSKILYLVQLLLILCEIQFVFRKTHFECVYLEGSQNHEILGMEETSRNAQVQFCPVQQTSSDHHPFTRETITFLYISDRE